MVYRVAGQCSIEKLGMQGIDHIDGIPEGDDDTERWIEPVNLLSRPFGIEISHRGLAKPRLFFRLREKLEVLCSSLKVTRHDEIGTEILGLLRQGHKDLRVGPKAFVYRGGATLWRTY